MACSYHCREDLRSCVGGSGEGGLAGVAGGVRTALSTIHLDLHPGNGLRLTNRFEWNLKLRSLRLQRGKYCLLIADRNKSIVMDPTISHPTAFPYYGQNEQLVWVLCKPDFAQGVFLPVFTLKDFGLVKTEEVPTDASPAALPSPSDLKLKARSVWGETEDSLLFAYVTKHGVHSWAKIASMINQEVHDGDLVRLGKHCRERWYNHLNPELNSMIYSENEWNPEEDLKLIKLQLDMGNSWSKIAREMSGRTENSVKNRWNSLIKKARSSMKLHHDSVSSVARKLHKLLECECGEAKVEA